MDNSYFNWSGGKDSALALYKLEKSGETMPSCLLTTISESYDRVSMHGVRRVLLEQQADVIGIPLVKVFLPEMPDMRTYERVMEKNLRKLRAGGISTAIFGDIYLEDLRKYRESKLAELGFKCRFPLWKIPTKELIEEFIAVGFKAVTVCVDTKFLDKSFVGRVIDRNFVRDLPQNVDPCGENGEFHSFVYDGPIFKRPLKIITGEKVYRKYARAAGVEGSQVNPKADPFETGFWYCDLLSDEPAQKSQETVK